MSTNPKNLFFKHEYLYSNNLHPCLLSQFLTPHAPNPKQPSPIASQKPNPDRMTTPKNQ
jgi:hypothetical protein